jgi:hypothetical protein
MSEAQPHGFGKSSLYNIPQVLRLVLAKKLVSVETILAFPFLSMCQTALSILVRIGLNLLNTE